MDSFTGITYLLRDGDSWWLCKNTPNDSTVWVAMDTGKRMDAPKGFVEPWLNPARNTLKPVSSVDELYAMYEQRLVPTAAFTISHKLLIGGNKSINKLSGKPAQQALIYTLVKPRDEGNSFEHDGKLWQKFSTSELATLHNELPDKEGSMAREIRTMLVLTPLSYPAAAEKSAESVPEFDAAKPVKQKTFYIPTFISGTGGTAFKILGVEEHDKNAFLNYASRIMPRQTAQDAIRADLKKDFNYHGRFKIRTIEYLDSIPDKDGQECKRYHISVVLEDPFEPAGRKVFGKTLIWMNNPS